MHEHPCAVRAVLTLTVPCVLCMTAPALCLAPGADRGP